MTDIEEVFYGLIQYINEDVSCKDHILYIIFDTTKPQPNHKVTPTHTEPQQYNPWNNSTNKSQAPEDGYINIRNMLSIK